VCVWVYMCAVAPVYCMYVCVCVCVCVYVIRGCKYVTDVRTYVYYVVDVSIRVHMCVCVVARVYCVCVCVYVCACM
jgi:hypothetical protein